jgi:8-oxo-dGTP diphosphatase
MNLYVTVSGARYWKKRALRSNRKLLRAVYKNMARGIVSMVFRCQVLDGTVHATDEAQDIRWVSEEEIAPLVDEAFAVRLLDGLRYAGTPAVREHDGIKLL